jgi:hypothetical protein
MEGKLFLSRARIFDKRSALRSALRVAIDVSTLEEEAPLKILEYSISNTIVGKD